MRDRLRALVRLGARLWARPVARRWAYGVVAVAAVVLVAPTVWAYASSGPYRTTVTAVRPHGVAIVFGAGIYGRTPSPFLAHRLDIARRLYASGKARVLLMTGDNSTPGYDEPTVMRDYLTARGVPPGRIVLDDAGFRTWDSCARARRIFGVRSAILITQSFHVPRATVLCRAAGLDVAAIGDDSASYDLPPTAWGYARELPANVRALIDIWTKPDPHFLGHPEPGVTRALR